MTTVQLHLLRTLSRMGSLPFAILANRHNLTTEDVQPLIDQGLIRETFADSHLWYILTPLGKLLTKH